ncbi:MAG: GNAT family N-acetyltransferase [Chloroflexota bacterium]
MSETPALTLRQYTIADHKAVMEVHRLGLLQMGWDGASGPWDADLEHIEDYYLRHGEFLVGTCDGRVVAIGGLRVLPSGVGELKRMRIHADYYGRRYDQILLEALTVRARELGATRLVLEVDERRVPAQELYARNGFIRQGTLLVGRTPSIVFEKELLATRPDDLDALLLETITAAKIAGLAVAWSHGGVPVELRIVGADIHGASLSSEALFPTASLSKLAVALGVLRLVDQGVLSLDAPIHEILPDAVVADGVTLRGLLCHTAGLPELPLVVEGSWSEIGLSCQTTPGDQAPGTRVAYSNHGYGLLGLALERVTNQSFGDALTSLVFKPLGLDAHVADALPRAPVQGWRFRVLPAGGVFMSVAAALTLIETFNHSRSRFVSPALLEMATQDQTGGVAGGMGPRLQWTRCPWGLGPEIRGDRYSPWIPRSAGAASFGHAGASGCVAWADPEANVSWAILTVPPTDRATGVRWHLQSRPNLADIGEAILTTCQSRIP